MIAGLISEECAGAIIGHAILGMLAKSVSNPFGIMNKISFTEN
jgi:hypothetical protein